MHLNYWHTAKESGALTTHTEAHKLSGPIVFLPQMPTLKACACRQHTCQKAPHPLSEFATSGFTAALPHGQRQDSLNSMLLPKPGWKLLWIQAAPKHSEWAIGMKPSAGNGSSPAPSQPGRARVDGWLQLLFPSLGSPLAVIHTGKKKMLLWYQQMEFINILPKRIL